MPDPKKFSFEHEFYLTKNEYLKRFSLFDHKTRHFRRFLMFATGCVCLLSTYTLLLGICLLILTIFSYVIPQILPGIAGRNYSELTYLHQPILYGVNNSKLWVHGKYFKFESGWRLVKDWNDENDMISIDTECGPTLWFPIDQLKQIGIYESVVSLCKKHSTHSK